MRFPLFLGLTAACLVAFKVVTIGTLCLGLLIVGSVVLPFVIVGALIFGLVTLVMWTVRFVFFCAKGPRQAAVNVPKPPPPPGAAGPAIHAAAPRPPWDHARYDWRRYSQGRGYGRRRRGVSWVWMVLTLVAVCAVLSNRVFSDRFPAFRHAFREHQVVKIVKTPKRLDHNHPQPPALDRDEDSDVEMEAAPTPAPAAPAKPEPRPQAEVAKQSTSGAFPQQWTVTGRGEDLDEARAEALSRAESKVLAYLWERSPKIEWTPDSAYIEEHLIKRPAREAPRLKVADDLKVRQVELDVAITSDDYRDIKEQDRRYTMDRRMLWVGGGLAGLVALFSAVVGFIRVDEWTKGYYTRLLWLGAFVFVSATGSAVVLLMK